MESHASYRKACWPIPSLHAICLKLHGSVRQESLVVSKRPGDTGLTIRRSSLRTAIINEAQILRCHPLQSPFVREIFTIFACRNILVTCDCLKRPLISHCFRLPIRFTFPFCSEVPSTSLTQSSLAWYQLVSMISLSIYGYKKYKKHQEKKKFREAAGEAPEIVDQSAEFAQSPTSSLPSGPAKGGALHHAKSNSSGYSGTASEPSSAVEPNSASSEYQSYQQYLERQSNPYLKGVPDQPPTYQAALSPPPEQARGQWIFVPAGGPVPFANGPPAIPQPPSPLPGSPLSPGSVPASSPLTNILPASPPPAAYAKSTPNELPAQVPMGFGGNTAPAKQGKTPRFELPAAETFPPSRELQRSDSDAGSRKSGEIKRYELA
jgi:hypothetical protein